MNDYQFTTSRGQSSRVTVNTSYAAHWLGACHVFDRCPWCELDRATGTG